MGEESGREGGKERGSGRILMGFAGEAGGTEHSSITSCLGFNTVFLEVSDFKN